MPRHHDDDDDDDDDDGDDYGGADDDDAETVECPHCGADVYEDAEQCPRCGKYLSAEDRPTTRPNGFMIFGMLLALIAALIWVFG